MTTLYSLRTDGDQYRITKFVDGEVESSYLSTQFECECPAGHRPSCRHRQMIPDMLAHGICNTHWFYHFDIRRVVDFNGTLKSNFDAMNELAAIPGVQVLDINDPAGMHNAIAEAVGEAQHTELTPAPVEKLVDSPVSKTVNPVGSNPTGGTTSWRRL